MSINQYGLVNWALKRNGSIHTLIVDSEMTGGTGLMNPSVFVYDEKIMVNIRHVNYTLYHSEGKMFHHQWGPLQYLHPENDLTLRTFNYLAILDDDLSIKYCHKVDTSLLDKDPQWHFIGLEDARLFNWDGRFYLCGVRRDDNKTGAGRMMLAEIEIREDSVREISRFKIPAPKGDKSYCEKNWMPVTDMPMHFVKWSNPTEVVKADSTEQSCETVVLDESKIYPLQRDLRGSSQVIPWRDGHLAITHEVYLYNDLQGRKDGRYRHRFVYWDKNWNIVKTSEDFSFLTGEIEFCAGAALHGDNILISFGFQDNSAYILKMPSHLVDTLLK